MKALGIVRNLDELGRLTIPKEVRKTNKWEDKAPMEMFMTEQGLLIRKYEDRSEELNEVLHDLKKALNGGTLKRDSIEKAIKVLKTQK
jgi:bifunctional DNA-binding transcriptional regulator/antitoxin component of YhaV-PrlF toxin-antitoxin module